MFTTRTSVEPLPGLDTQQLREGNGEGQVSFCTRTTHRVGVTQPDILSRARKDSETASVALFGFEMVSHWVAQAGLEFEVLLSWMSK